jgi:hypothetical protein
MKTHLLLSCAITIAACSGNKTLVKGSIDGKELEFTASNFTLEFLDEIAQANRDADNLNGYAVGVTNLTQSDCGCDYDVVSNPSENYGEVGIILGPPQIKTFSFDKKGGGITFRFFDPGCQMESLIYDAASGTVAITDIAHDSDGLPSQISGNFTLHFGSHGMLTGSFSAGHCSRFDTVKPVP